MRFLFLYAFVTNALVFMDSTYLPHLGDYEMSAWKSISKFAFQSQNTGLVTDVIIYGRPHSEPCTVRLDLFSNEGRIGYSVSNTLHFESFDVSHSGWMLNNQSYYYVSIKMENYCSHYLSSGYDSLSPFSIQPRYENKDTVLTKGGYLRM